MGVIRKGCPRFFCTSFLPKLLVPLCNPYSVPRIYTHILLQIK